MLRNIVPALSTRSNNDNKRLLLLHRTSVLRTMLLRLTSLNPSNLLFFKFLNFILPSSDSFRKFNFHRFNSKFKLNNCEVEKLTKYFSIPNSLLFCSEICLVEFELKKTNRITIRCINWLKLTRMPSEQFARWNFWLLVASFAKLCGRTMWKTLLNNTQPVTWTCFPELKSFKRGKLLFC